jgi:2,5-diamino-6-(ribosylamino)-4(3H)-pyrimidinone 5'-phosphate reductase
MQNKSQFPQIIMHNEISLDGSITGYKSNMMLYYQISQAYHTDMVFVGSATAKKGLEMFLDNIPKENQEDFIQPTSEEKLENPYWLIPDSKGILMNLLHVYRKSSFCRDVIILTNNSTPKAYIDYLKKRNYLVLHSHTNNTDLKKILPEIKNRFKVETLLTDSGGILNSILLEQNMIDEISLLISPNLIGETTKNLFRSLKTKENTPINLELLEVRALTNSYLHVRYQIGAIEN